MGAMALDIRDAAGAPMTARVSVRGSDGRDYAPDDAMIHADDFVDTSRGGTETHYFHAQYGVTSLFVPSGSAEISVWRGLESKPHHETISIPEGRPAAADIVLSPLDPDEVFANWWSGDVHVHMNYGGNYRMNAEQLAMQAEAEDLDLVFNLIVNKEQRIPDIGEFSPTPTRVEGSPVVIAQAQEFHTSVWGHLGLLGLNDHILISDYAGYPKTAAHSLYPDNATVADLAHAQGALVGYVHPYDPPAPDPEADAPLRHSLPVDVALGKVDYVEVVGFSDHKVTSDVWFRLLNCGFRIPAAGGTDAMTNYASLRGPIGLDRTYVDMGASPPADPAAFTRAWLDGLKAGKSFATNGPLLSLEVEGRGPGGEIRLGKGVHKAKVQVRMLSIAAVDALEIIVNGKVAATIPLKEEGRAAEYAGEIELAASGWIALRASSEKSSPDVFDLYPFAVTSPVYVSIGGKPARSAADADYFIKWIGRIEEFAMASDDWNTLAEKRAVLDHIARAKREFEKRR
jgi:hypothetical protein